MRGWSSPPVPAVPGGVRRYGLRLHDSAQRSAIDVLAPLADGELFRLYVCGITPYDAAHLGHASTYVAFDLVQRVARDQGHEVRYVQNVTDVDDPLLERALITGEDWSDLAAREIERFRDDMTALRVLAPDEYIGAVESIPQVIERIDRLRDLGAAYRVDDDWYFARSADSAFGGEAGLDDAAMRALFAERGGDPDRAGKRDPLDPLLWRARREGEPWWPAPSIGEGRPGWHVECVAIAVDGLGQPFDLQGGGSDLVFPHHTMCASIARVLAGGQPFARHYVHTGMLALDGEKMSKSKGNLEFVSRLRSAGHPPAAIRLALLSRHYRADWEWSAPVLDDATARLQRWQEGVRRPTATPAADLVAAVRAALADDLDAPRALAAMDAWCASDGDDAAAGAQAADAVDALLGIALEV